MGEAKRRGTKEQRIEQSIERRKIEDAKRSEEFRRREVARLRALPVEERKQVILAGGGARSRHDARMLMATLAGLSAPLLVVRNRDDDIGGQE